LRILAGPLPQAQYQLVSQPINPDCHNRDPSISAFKLKRG
jgi:hypothetical protein